MRDVIVGTAGHIDHGKTTLLKTLTGINTDRLDEEKRRGISIDIGFAHMRLGSYRIGFVDVPGHERFVKNMLAGVGGIHLVLLVVAADESVMPQTLEHFQICKLLEIPRGVIVITKKSLVEDEFLPLVEEEIRELTKGSLLEAAPVVQVDSTSGDGIEFLKQTLLSEVRHYEKEFSSTRDSREVFRLPIDRVFTIRGFGTVITGTPCSGSLNKGDHVAILPNGITGKVRGIEIFKEKSDSAKAGQRTALNLTGLEKESLERGMVVAAVNTLRPSRMLDAVVHLLPGAPCPLKNRAAIRFHHGSAEIFGRIHLLDESYLSPGDSTLVQLRLERPVLCCPKDHFILRRYSPITTIAGGVILDNLPVKHKKRDLADFIPELRKLHDLLKSKDSWIDTALVEYLVRSCKHDGIPLIELIARTGFLEGYLREILGESQEIVLTSQEPATAIFKPALEELKQTLVQFLHDFHTSTPLARGVPQEELKEKFFKRSPASYFQFVLHHLQKEERIHFGAGTVSLFGYQMELNAQQNLVKKDILKLLKGYKFQPPSLRKILEQLPHKAREVRDVYYFLLQIGQLIRINEDIVLADTQVATLKSQLEQSFSEGRSFTVAEFKTLFDISRKYAIPFLEFLDRQRITRRVGDKRLVL